MPRHRQSAIIRVTISSTPRCGPAVPGSASTPERKQKLCHGSPGVLPSVSSKRREKRTRLDACRMSQHDALGVRFAAVFLYNQRLINVPLHACAEEEKHNEVTNAT